MYIFLPACGQVQDAGSQKVVANVSSATPFFTVEGLAPGRDYLVLVTASNTQGESSPYLLHGFALKVAENKISKWHAGLVCVCVYVAFRLYIEALSHCTVRP